MNYYWCPCITTTVTPALLLLVSLHWLEIDSKITELLLVSLHFSDFSNVFEANFSKNH